MKNTLVAEKTDIDEDSNETNRLDKKFLIVQSNDLISAKYALSLQEKRFFLILTSLIKKEDVDFKAYKIGIKEYCDLLNLRTDSQYTAVKQITRSLTTKPLIVKMPNGEVQTTCLASAKYINNKACVEVRFVPELKPHLIQLHKDFTKFKMENILKLKSIYSINLYAKLKHIKFWKRKTKISINELRFILCINENKYKKYADLKRKILKPSVEDINKKTDIKIMMNEIKNGKKVSMVEFLVDRNENHQKNKKNVKDIEIKILPELIELLPIDFRNNNELLKLMSKHLKSHNYNYVYENTKYAVEKTKHPDNIYAFNSFLKKSLNENYANSNISIQTTARQAKYEINIKRQKEQEKERVEKLRMKKIKEELNHYKKLLDNLNDTELEEYNKYIDKKYPNQLRFPAIRKNQLLYNIKEYLKYKV